MAKSARSSRVKANKTRLRETIFKPASEARTVRLSERLLAAANARKAVAMEVEAGKSANVAEEQMDIDEKVAGVGARKKRALATKVKKRQSSRHAVVFQGLSKDRKKKSRGKK